MNKEKTTLIVDSSYHICRDWMSKEKQGKFIYPCIQNVGKGNVITNTWYSNTNKRGHFGLSTSKENTVFVKEAEP
jgi:hypothetical protein